MKVATLSIGDELICGEVTDTNQSYLATRLYDLGLRAERHLMVGDDEEAIVAALNELAAVYDVVLATGGLGPTPDDLTSAAAARAAGVPLAHSPEAQAHLAEFAKRLNRELHPLNDRQAQLPQGCGLIPNPNGTATGFRVSIGRADCYFMPGVPFEMKPMLEETVLPVLLTASGVTPGLRSTLKIFGLPEAVAAAELEGVLPEGSPVQLAYCVKFPEIHLILRTPGTHPAEHQAALAALRGRMAHHLFAEDEATLDSVLAELFRKTGATLALAESCTGGMIAERVTRTAGSSAWFLEGAVTYSNEAKSRLLGVAPELIAARGAVSEEVALAMAEGARAKSGAAIAISVTGIAGPEGGSAEKPVGTVYIALADAKGCRAKRHQFPGDRERVRAITCFTALNWLRRQLLAGKVRG
ncbi:CinA-like protein [Geomonas silvestris]|uniref:CinA-like protein n=1 Tax=Geomonas silvestris TaxID=2740184 RepID=A0A6V8MGS1_9BACT|nr:competence/damage-inducible protein A [Geomonas silvestris]GFO59165.1 CinA-like protein [Geomonas silvestris]